MAPSTDDGGGGGDAAGEAAARETEARRGVQLHGALDLAFAALYAWVGFVLAPSRQHAFAIALSVVVALLAASGVALLLRLRVARPIALATQAVLLAFCMTVVALLVASAAYLRGIYGPLGQGMAALVAMMAALVVEGCGLLPLLQIRLLLRPEVRRLLDGVRGAARGR